MTNLLSRRPERPLPPGRHEKLRADLLDTLETDEARSPRRVLAPVAAAAAVLAVAAGLAFAVPALNRDDGAPVTGQEAKQPATRELSAAETAKLRTQCLAEANRVGAGAKRPFEDYKTLGAFEFVDVTDPKIVSTWLMGSGTEQRGGATVFTVPMYWLCSRTAGGVISESSIRMGQEPITLTGTQVFRLARNAGVYTSPVARVTVQPKGGKPIEAVLRDGFYFVPTVGRTGWSPFDATDPLADAYVIRAYDAAGHELSSSDNRKSTENCPPGKDWVTTVPRPPVVTPRPTVIAADPACQEYYWPY